MQPLQRRRVFAFHRKVFALHGKGSATKWVKRRVRTLNFRKFRGHQDYRYTLPVSLTISILAVLVAGATLLGHRAHTEELLLQSRATDQWSYYQAKEYSVS